MGFIIWYKIEFKEEQTSPLAQAASALPLGTSLPLRVSNDVFSGKYILDADITLTMTAGDTADTFAIKLTNLPLEAADQLKTKHVDGVSKNPPQPLLVEIYLGYFDELSMSESSPAMKGAVTSVTNTINESGLLETLVEGQETAGYQLRTTCMPLDNSGELTANDLVQKIADAAKVQVADGSQLDPSIKVNAFTLKTANGLDALRQIANIATAPLVIRDGKIYVGPSVGKDEAPVHFDPDINIVKQDQMHDTEEINDPCKKRKNGKVQSKSVTSLKLTVLGHPILRVGQKAVLKDPPTGAGTLRINQLTHTFSTRNGYTCDMTIVAAEPGKIAGNLTGVHGLVNRFRDLAENVQNQKPALDVGQVTEYEPGNQQKHLTTLNYGQSPSPSDVAPSVEIAVDDSLQLHHKPIASPFAWHKCGLIVPVYPGMRALLAHNLGLVNDAVVAGFLWSEQPTYDRPKNKEGDYWLCLPTDFEESGDKRPKGKGVNDLTDKSGLRVIQAKGLHIFVGNDKLPDVGERPDPPDAQTIVIEHESGTTIKVANDGAVSIETKSKDISLTNGSVTLKLGSSGVEVS